MNLGSRFFRPTTRRNDRRPSPMSALTSRELRIMIAYSNVYPLAESFVCRPISKESY